MNATTAGSIQARDLDFGKLELEDACRLKSDPSLVGHVSRTFHDIETHGPLTDEFIILYAPVPEAMLMDFLSTGKPPKGYVLVTFCEPSQGSSLIHEDDLELIDRTLPIGQVVKRHPKDTLSGTVISSSTRCTLEPIAFRTIDPSTGDHGPVHFTEKRAKRPIDPAEDIPSLLVHDVPVTDIKHHEEFSEGDFIVYRQKLGIIRQITREIVLVLGNHTVVAPEANEFDMSVSVGSRPILSFPGDPEVPKPYPLNQEEVVWSQEADTLYPGQFVLSDDRSVRMGDWIYGSYSDSVPPEGYVIAAKPMDVTVDWLCPNVFAVGMPYVSEGRETVRASTLFGKAAKCDFGALPRDGLNGQRIRSDSWLGIGDRARFRDPTEAAAKYPGFQSIPAQDCCGYDLNVFRIVSSKTEVRVQWQDLSITTEEATVLRTFTSSEDEVWPGDLVTLREGAKSVPNPGRDRPEPLAAHFQGFQDDNIIVPKKVGVVQKVNSAERIATVCWYKNPKVQLLHNGNILRPSSTLGELSDMTTDVSLYELSTHPGLSKARGDLVLIAPEKVHKSILSEGSSNPSSTAAGPCTLSYLFPISFFQVSVYLEYLKMVLVHADWFRDAVEIDSAPLPSRHDVHRDEYSVKAPVDYLGRIIAIDMDGTITVRLATADNCHDIRVPLEKILMVIDDDGTPEEPAIPSFNVGFDINDPDDLPITTTVEYEGGERLDDDSGDDMWTTDDDDDYEDSNEGNDEEDNDDHDNNNNIVISELRLDPTTDETNISDETSTGVCEDGELAILTMQLPVSRPPSFAVLDGSPPPDHAFLSRPATDVPVAQIKRIRKEYQILESSLPPGIIVRTWESRLDLLRVLIIGPQGTPYEYAPHVIDIHFGHNFPNTPPDSFFHSWTNGMGRINPNLYEDGKICLSILGTWPSQNPDEIWSPVKSTVLQILVSIMGLVLVKTPFYNEAGFEIFASEGDGRVESIQYTEKAFVLTRHFIDIALRQPVAGFEDVLIWHYLPGPVRNDENDNTAELEHPRLLRKAISEAKAMIEHHNATSSSSAETIEKNAASPFVNRLSLGAVIMLRKHIAALEKIEAAAIQKFS